MSKVALLFGFMYKHNINYNKLPGTVIDLYNTYHFLKNNGYNSIMVVTDIVKDINRNKLKQYIFDGKVNSDIISFIEFLKKERDLYIFKSIEELLRDIPKFIHNAKFLYLYYSGHAKKNTLCFPNQALFCTLYGDDVPINNILFTKDLMKLIIDSVSINCQILFIFDCCNGSNFNLPFYLNDNNNFKLNNNDYSLNLNMDIICIMSTINGETTNSHQSGSSFTNVLIENLKNKDIKTWIELKNKIIDGIKLSPNFNDQTISIYSSLIINKHIWNWINTSDHMSLKWDYENNFLVKY